MSIRVSYVVITRNRRELLLKCLESIHRQSYDDREIIVVDNASDDGTANAVRADFPHAIVRELTKNAGVPEARNVGITAASGSICIIIDDDATFSDALATTKAVGFFRREPQLAALGFCIRNASTGRLERRAIPSSNKSAGKPLDGVCPYFTGAGFALRKEPFLEIGLFWDNLFYIGEELDLSYRLLDHQFTIRYTSTVEVLHFATEQARPSGQYVYFNTRNRPWIAARHLPWQCVLSTISIWWLAMAALSIRHLQIVPFLRGMKDSITGFHKALKTRRQISAQTLERLRRMSGRIWY